MSPNAPKTILQQARERHDSLASQGLPSRAPEKVRRTTYKSLPVPYAPDFLSLLADPESTISVKRIDFKNSVLPEYKGCFAVVLDGVLSQEECESLVRYAEMSVGAHGNDPPPLSVHESEEGGEGNSSLEAEGAKAEHEALTNPLDNGWKPALVNAGRNYEILAPDYRNSDRIIWDEAEIAKRIWKRILQGKGMKSYFGELKGKGYVPVVGGSALWEGDRRVVTEQGLNERMRFLRYGAGQFFKEHCDGHYESEDGLEESFYTMHLYLNDSAQALGIEIDPENRPGDYLHGGATTFHATKPGSRMDIDPKAGRVLVFQQRRLLHSGDAVVSGTKYTMRSDVMYRFESDDVVGGEGDVVFG